MQFDWTIVVSTFIGGFLAAGVGYLFERRREKTRLTQARQLLTIAICDDLEHTLPLYDKVAEESEKTKTVWFATLNELRESRFTADRSISTDVGTTDDRARAEGL